GRRPAGPAAEGRARLRARHLPRQRLLQSPAGDLRPPTRRARRRARSRHEPASERRLPGLRGGRHNRERPAPPLLADRDREPGGVLSPPPGHVLGWHRQERSFGCALALPYSFIHGEGGGDMSTGTVKWFNDAKGYGFIAPDD